MRPTIASLAQERARLHALGGGGGDAAQPERRVQADAPAPHRGGHGVDELVERHDGAPRDVEGPSDGGRRSQGDFDGAGGVVHVDRLKSRLAGPEDREDERDFLHEPDEFREMETAALPVKHREAENRELEPGSRDESLRLGLGLAVGVLDRVNG